MSTTEICRHSYSHSRTKATIQRTALCSSFLVVWLFGSHVGCGPSHTQASILEEFARRFPAEHAAMLVFGVNPSGNLLCFRAKEGCTYVYRRRNNQVEPICHAKALRQIDRISYKKGFFLLWQGKELALSIGIDE